MLIVLESILWIFLFSICFVFGCIFIRCIRSQKELTYHYSHQQSVHMVHRQALYHWSMVELLHYAARTSYEERFLSVVDRLIEMNEQEVKDVASEKEDTRVVRSSYN